MNICFALNKNWFDISINDYVNFVFSNTSVNFMFRSRKAAD